MTDAPEMKPCPFCGGEDVEPSACRHGRIHCFRCGADGPVIPYAPDKHAWTWNRRADLPPPLTEAVTRPEVRALVEALNQYQLAAAGFVSVQSARNMADAALAKLPKGGEE